MLRSITAIVLIASLLSGLMIQSLILAHFEVNRSTIVSTLCVKKNDANNTCQGKCHLTKQLTKTEEQQEEYPASANLKLEWTIASASAYFNHCHTYLKNYRLGDNKLLAGVRIGIFHPPKSV